MKNNPNLYFIVLVASLIALIVEVFIIKLEGAIGLTICILSFYLIVGCIIRLCRLTNLLNENIMEAIDILFF